MSLNKKASLVEVAKLICRDLRKRNTKAEQILWEKLRNRKFLNMKFYRQYPLFYDLAGKESFFVADFYCFEEKLVIELDGGIHPYQSKQDKNRTDILNAKGLRVIRFKNSDIKENINVVVEKLKEEISTHPNPSLK